MTRPQRALPGATRALAFHDSARHLDTSEAPLVDFLRRWWLLLFIGSLVGAGAGFAYSKLGPVSYQSVAMLQVRPDPNSSRAAVDAQVAALGYAAEAMAPSMLDHVSKALQKDGINIAASDLLAMSNSNKLSVQPVKGSSAITISTTFDDPNVAQAVADKVASIAVDDSAAQAAAESDSRKKELQDSINRTRDQLTGAQLFAQEQELQQRLDAQQALLLQLQNTYQQTLQQQVQIALLMRQQSVPPPQTPVPSAEQQRQMTTFSAISAESLATEMDMLKGQQVAAQQAINELDSELSAVRGQLASMPDPTLGGADTSGTLDATARIQTLQQQQAALRDQVGQWQQLDKQAHDLQVQSNEQHNQIRALQSQIQQATITQQTGDQQRQQQQASLQDQIQRELAHQSLVRANIDTIVPLKGQTDLNNQQQIQMQAALTDLADSKAKVDGLKAQLQQLQQGGPPNNTAANLQILQKQLQDTQTQSAAIDSQLQDTQRQQTNLQNALGPNPNGMIQAMADQITLLQQQQRDQDKQDQFAVTQWNSLKQQEQDLVRQREVARQQLVQIQHAQQDDVQRQADLNQKNIQAQVASQAQAAPTPEPIPSSILDQSADLRNGLLSQIEAQQQQVAQTIAALNGQLDKVHAAEAALPVKLEPAQAAAEVTVATQQLAQLTQEYTKLLVNEASGVGPLARFGPAAPATPVGSSLRMLPVGAAGGLAVAAGLAYLLQTLLGARGRRLSPPPAAGGTGGSSTRRMGWDRRRPRLTTAGLADAGAQSSARSA